MHADAHAIRKMKNDDRDLLNKRSDRTQNIETRFKSLIAHGLNNILKKDVPLNVDGSNPIVPAWQELLLMI